MIELVNLCGGYHGVTVVQDVNTRFPAGALSIIIGSNGCGKSTLLRMAAALASPQKGQVLLNGKDIKEYPARLLAQRLAYLPQSRNSHAISVQNLVLHGRFPHLSYPRRYRPEDRKIAWDVMCRLGIENLATHNMDELSGGERQKAYIAMLLAQGGDVLFMDEPITFLDISHQLELLCIARQLQAMGKTIVMVLHDLNLALRYADRLFVMEGGRICCEGTAESIFDSGVLDRVFHVKSACCEVEGLGRQYYFVRGDEE